MKSKRNFKSKIVTGIFGATISAMVCLPVFAKTYTASWSFTMKHRFVQGCDNGQYYSLGKGTAYISGTIDNTLKSGKPAGTTPNAIYVLLLREKFGPDEGVGNTINLGDSTNITFSEKKLGKTSCKSSKYYLQFYKLYEDYYTATGSGTVVTK